MIRRGLVTRNLGAARLNLESDEAAIEELSVSEVPADEIIEEANAEIAEVFHEQVSNDEEFTAVSEEVVSLESCLTSMTTIMNMESIAEDLVTDGATEEEAVGSVISTVVDAVEAVEPGIAEEEGVAMEAEVPGAGKRFWDHVKAVFKKIKEAVLSIFRSILVRLGRFWDNMSQSSDRVKRASVQLLAVMKKLSVWNEEAVLNGRSAWVINGKIDPNTIENTVRDQLNINKGFTAFFKKEVNVLQGMATQIKNSTENNLRTLASGKIPGEEQSNSVIKTIEEGKLKKGDRKMDFGVDNMLKLFIGFEVDSATGQIGSAKLAEKTTVKVGSRNTIQSILNNIIRVASAVTGDSGTLKADLKKMQGAIEDAIGIAEKALNSMEKDADPQLKEAAQARINQLRSLRGQVGDMIGSMKWYFKGLPLRSCNNALSFASAAIRAAGVEEKKAA